MNVFSLAMKSPALICLCSVLSLFAAQTASAAGPILPAPTRVSEHLYAWIGPHGGPSPENKGFRMNMGFVVGKDAVAVSATSRSFPGTASPRNSRRSNSQRANI